MDNFENEFYKLLYAKNSKLAGLARTRLVNPPALKNELHEVALNLSVPEVNILAHLENKFVPQTETKKSKNLCMTQFADLLGFSKATISVAVESLVQKELVERYFLNNNRKTTYIRLTQLGRELGETEDRIHAEYLKKQLLKHATEEEIIAIDKAYDTLIAIYSKFESQKKP
jgi:DNA-binding MarR family transcriptional regulator